MQFNKICLANVHIVMKLNVLIVWYLLSLKIYHRMLLKIAILNKESSSAYRKYQISFIVHFKYNS